MTATRLAIAIILCVAPASRADTPAENQAKAQVMFDAGERAYQLKDYDGAARQFLGAYELVKDPVYLFNIAQAFRMAKRCRQAQGFYKDFLTAAPESRSRAAIEGWLRELQPCADAEAEVERQRLELEQRDRERARHPQTMEIDRGRRLRIGGIATAVAGVAALAVGTGYAIHSRTIQRQLESLCASPGGCPYEPDPMNAVYKLHADGSRANEIAAVGFIAGGILVATGAGLYVWGRARVETVVVVEPRTGSAAVSARIRF